MTEKFILFRTQFLTRLSNSNFSGFSGLALRVLRLVMLTEVS
jgi:hypothetical protein